MAARRILITGGAGFIGSHLADHLLARGDAVRALDVLSPQVHGPDPGRPHYLDAALNEWAPRTSLREGIERLHAWLEEAEGVPRTAATEVAP
jgi:NAD(P)-dependent dehydrogenase (short-subunit alcohol dehydrogenase family)